MPPKPPKDRLDVVYDRCFKNQPEGYAVYHLVSAEELRPGMCGYFDNEGNWQKLTDLTDPDQLTRGGLTLPQLDIKVTPGAARWPFRKSESVVKVESSFRTEVKPASATPGGDIEVAYKSRTGEGVILLTEGDVRHVQATPGAELAQWMKQNARKLLIDNPDVKERGLWIISKTYSVPRRRFHMLMSKDAELVFSIRAQAQAVGRVEATAEWWRRQQSEDWIEHENRESGVVLAFNGIFWQDKWWSTKVKPVTYRRPTYLGSDCNTDILNLEPFEFEMPNQDLGVAMVPDIRGQIDGVALAGSLPTSDEDSESSEDS